MTQAVVHVRIEAPSLAAITDSSTFGLTFVNTGAGAMFGTDPGASALRTAIKNSLTTATGGASHALGVYLGQMIDRGTNMAKITTTDVTAHLDGSPAGPPLAVDSWTVPAAIADPPQAPGVAICVSWRADYGSDVEFGSLDTTIPTDRRAQVEGAPATHTGHDRPRARDRNRLYFGPLCGDILATFSGLNNDARWRTAFITDVLDGFSAMNGIDGGAGTTWTLCTWSRRNAGVKNAVTMYTDDRPDYQRRRSDNPGIRTFKSL